MQPMTYFKIPFIALWGLITFLAIEVFVFLPLYLIGIPLTIAASRYARIKVVPSRLYPERDIIAYSNQVLDWWIGNYEDGLDPEFEWWDSSKTALDWFLRNPVCNLRFVPIISTKPDPLRVRFIGTLDEIPHQNRPGWFLCWQGGYVGFFYQNESWGIWLGFKVNPRDARYVLPDDYRNWGIGTVAQFWKVDPK